jgi:predicted TIM-barrel fold metal-dependent hydrolase
MPPYTGPIIDLHAHVGEEKEGIEERPGCEDWWIGPSPEATIFMQKARGWFAKHKKDPRAMDMDYVPPLTLEIMIEQMDEAGVEKACINGVKGYMRKSYTGIWKDKGNVYECPNDYVAECIKKYPDRFVGTIGVDPYNGKKEVDEIEKYVNEYGLDKCAGIKIWTPAGIAPNNKELCYPLYEKCLEYDISVHVHTGAESLEGCRLMYNNVPVTSPLCVEEAAADFPDLRFLCLHASCFMYHGELMGVVISKHNVWFDTSALIPEVMWFKAFGRDYETYLVWQKLFADKVCFGSEYPLFTFPYTDTLAALATYSLEPGFHRKYFYENAKHFLGPNCFPEIKEEKPGH